MKRQQDNESRLDRIERGLELLLQGTSELKESQKKTDEQLQKTNAQLLELKESQDRTDAQIEETGELLQKTIRKLDEIGRQLGDLGLVQGEVAEDLPCYPFRCVLSLH